MSKTLVLFSLSLQCYFHLYWMGLTNPMNQFEPFCSIQSM